MHYHYHYHYRYHHHHYHDHDHFDHDSLIREGGSQGKLRCRTLPQFMLAHVHMQHSFAVAVLIVRIRWQDSNELGLMKCWGLWELGAHPIPRLFRVMKGSTLCCCCCCRRLLKQIFLRLPRILTVYIYMM